MAVCAKLCLGGYVFFLILLRKIRKNSIYLPGVSAASPRRIFWVCVHGVRADARTPCTQTQKILRSEAADTPGK